ncbi:MAG: EscU/YscU/HrcU family type III secretion system export apparatus switch protein [Oscillospiraceae bacterium]|nr:EscU/YscU/HrcU family type III secretion system export apparatus switch protein [Oscillospiraceae bacterium]
MDESILRKRAAAISYNHENDDAPVLAAFGHGYLADRIVSAAKESGVPIVEDPGAAELFSKVSVGDEIPPEMYEVVARILVFIAEADRKYGDLRGYSMRN